ncbi:nicotinamide-nucleotide amidohydrolase family protein, partial [Omnitrophica bacterium]|nr:nicotinamide-nucleotide amidohydrolase family protein [Candidatus Omnitrophota bacterium]
LKKLKGRAWTIKSRSLKLIGLPEARVNDKVEDLLQLSGQITVGIYTYVGEVALRITVKAKTDKAADTAIKRLENKIKKRLGDVVYGTDNETLQEVVGRILTKSKKTLAIAESCTGGGVSDLITNVPGSSNYFTMGIIAYSNRNKIKRLNIKGDLIKKYGAVSKDVAKSMADNVREVANTDIGLGITGIAGPGGQTKKKPIGLVYIALSTKKKKIMKEFRFSGSREEIKLQASQQALNLLRLNL